LLRARASAIALATSSGEVATMVWRLGWEAGLACDRRRPPVADVHQPFVGER
jgi:hypothetical protein